MKKITTLVLAVLLLLGTVRTVHATESPDLDRTGSLTLVMQWDGLDLNSGSLTIFQVGEVKYVDIAWTFVLIPELQDSGLSLENLEDKQLPGKLARQVKAKNISGITGPIQEGKAVFTDLPIGLYLVTQEEPCNGLSPINPFLISLPQWAENGYVYDLTARPKVSLEPLPTKPPETEPEEPSESKLPQTGQLNWPVPVMAVAGLILLALGWYLCYGKKRSPEG